MGEKNPHDLISECLARLAAGDPAARDRLVDLCYERLRAIARRMLGGFPGIRRWEESDDVVQEAAMRLDRAIRQLTLAAPRDVFAIAATQVHRVLLDMARRHGGPMSFAANHASITDPADHPVDHAAAPRENLERWTAFHEAIQRLPERLREIFHLVWHLGCDQDTVSRLTGRSVRTVKRDWRECRERIRRELGTESPLEA